MEAGFCDGNGKAAAGADGEGRDGFWIHRFLKSVGVESHVVDSASIEVKRRGKRRKMDRLDLGALLRLLIRYWGGGKKVWSVVQVPSSEAEFRSGFETVLDSMEIWDGGSSRMRRIGIVALARRLLVELWRYLEAGALPEGAVTKA